MQQSKLFESFRKLNPKQLSRFEEFLMSPYFNKNEENILFFQYLKKYAPDFVHKNLSKEKVMEKLPTPKKLNKKSLAYLMSRQSKLLDEFLSVEYLQSGRAGPPLHLLEQYRSLDLPRHRQAVESAVQKWMDEFPFRTACFYQQQFLFRRQQYEYSGHNERGYNEKLQQATDALDIYFILEKLRCACEMLNFSSSLHLNYQIDFAEQVATWANAEKFREVPVVQVYQKMFFLLNNPESQHYFEEIKKLLEKHAAIFTKKELKELYTLLLNYGTRRINRFNDEKYWLEYLDINQVLLANGLIFEEGLLSPWRYTNLVTVGLRTGQVSWTKLFIEEYKSKLPEAYANNLYQYNLAQFYYHQQQFDPAQRALLHVEFTDVLLNISARSLLIKIYFETDQTELLLSYLEATRIFLLRNKTLDHHFKKQLKNFIKICTRLVKADSDTDSLQLLLEKLPPAEAVLHRDWLYAKMKERMGRVK